MYAAFIAVQVLDAFNGAVKRYRVRKLGEAIADMQGRAASYAKERAALLREAQDHYRTRELYKAAARDLVARDGEVTSFAVDAYYVAESSDIYYRDCHERADAASALAATAIDAVRDLEARLAGITN